MRTILLASPNQYGYFTIYYNYAKFLSRELNIIYVCFDQGEKKFEPVENVKVIYVPLSANKILRIFNYYTKIVQAFDLNLNTKLILKYYFFSSLLNLFIPRKDLFLDIRTGYISGNKTKTLFFNFIIRLESFFFKRVITLSESLRKKLKLSINKTTIIPLGACPVNVPFKTFEKLKMLYVGTLTSRNLYQTVEGLAQLVKKFGDKFNIEYYIVGGGNYNDQKKLIDNIDYFNLKEIVHYEGPVYGESLKSYFVNCNLGVIYIPIIEDYNCQPATKTIEYLMAGMPVIATETYENKQMISDYNGILVRDNPQSFAEGLEKIISEKEKYHSSKIKDSVKEYSFEFIIENKLKPLLLF